MKLLTGAAALTAFLLILLFALPLLGVLCLIGFARDKPLRRPRR